MNYYNEFDEFAADWLENLIAAGLIPQGHVDRRSIKEVQPDDLRGYHQAHFFCGIAGWPEALRLAGWTGPCWTGSCPCQPFSVAGKQAGFSDERHLWPEFKRLIAKCRPPVIFGEQVAKATDWLNLVRSDLVEMDYAVGAMPIEAASTGADHFRDRYWFVADRNFQLASEEREQRGGQFSGPGGMANGNGGRWRQAQPSSSAQGGKSHTHLANGSSLVNDPSLGWGEGWTESEFRSRGFTAAVASIDGCQYVECPDGKWRRLPPPRVRWLGNGIPSRVAKLRAIGNAIDTRVAAEFIRAYFECVPDLQT